MADQPSTPHGARMLLKEVDALVQASSPWEKYCLLDLPLVGQLGDELRTPARKEYKS